MPSFMRAIGYIIIGAGTLYLVGSILETIYTRGASLTLPVGAFVSGLTAGLILNGFADIIESVRKIRDKLTA